MCDVILYRIANCSICILYIVVCVQAMLLARMSTCVCVYAQCVILAPQTSLW